MPVLEKMLFPRIVLSVLEATVIPVPALKAMVLPALGLSHRSCCSKQQHIRRPCIPCQPDHRRQDSLPPLGSALVPPQSARSVASGNVPGNVGIAQKNSKVTIAGDQVAGDRVSARGLTKGPDEYPRWVLPCAACPPDWFRYSCP